MRVWEKREQVMRVREKREQVVRVQAMKVREKREQVTKAPAMAKLQNETPQRALSDALAFQWPLLHDCRHTSHPLCTCGSSLRGLPPDAMTSPPAEPDKRHI